MDKRDKSILALQNIDSETDELKKNLEAMPEKRKLVEIETQIAKTRSCLAEAEKAVGDIKHAQKKREDESARLETKIANEEKKLYAGTINNPKELMSLQKEIKVLSDEKDTVDTEYLIGLDGLSGARESENKLRKDLVDSEVRTKELTSSIAKQTREVEDEIAAAAEKRKALVRVIDEITMKTYEQMRIKGHGIAVVIATDGVCGGCNLENSEDSEHGPSEGPVRRCEYCHRILISR